MPKKKPPAKRTSRPRRGRRRPGILASRSCTARSPSSSARAEALEATRLSCEARAAKIDRAALLARRATLEGGGAEVGDALAWVDREIAEADRVGEDARLAVAGIERVVAALSVIALASREDRGVRVRAHVDDPVEAVRVELDRREEAREEVEEEVARRRRAP